MWYVARCVDISERKIITVSDVRTSIQ